MYFSQITAGDEMKVNSTGKRCSVRGVVFVALLQLSFLTSMLNMHASAAQAPFHQSVAEFEAIFDDSRLLESLKGQLMTSIKHDGYKILVEAENGCVVRGSIRDIPRTDGSIGLRLFKISKLEVDSRYAGHVISPRSGGPTSATRLQDFKNLLNKLEDAHYALFMGSNIYKIELIGTNTFRITSNKVIGQHADIPFTPTVYTPPKDPFSTP